jgi:DNA-binding NarL/FixJ family response regulator
VIQTNSAQVIRVLIADDHPLMREALSSAIDDEPDMRVVAEAGDGLTVVQLATAIKPDVIIMDLFMPGQSGIDAITAIRSSDPQARIVALTSSADDELVLAAIQAGVLGYLMKDSQRTELLQAVRDVSCGRSFLPPSIAAKLANTIRRGGKQAPAARVEPLTEREAAVLHLVSQGDSNREIAAKLNVSEGTVRTHVHNILGKLALENRSQAIVYVLSEKLTTPQA